MAGDASYRRAEARAPTIATQPVSDSDILEQAIAGVNDMQCRAEAISAMILGAEALLQRQRGIMVDQKIGSSLCDNELWSGISTLLHLVRESADAVCTSGEAAEVAARRVIRPVAA